MYVLVGNWWTFVLRGVLAVLFGIFAMAMPGMALLTLVLAFGFYAAFDGILNIIAAFRRMGAAMQTPWWALLVSGVLGLVAGVIALLLPGITALALLFLIAGWAFVTGILEIIAAIRLRKQIRGEWMLILSGVLSVLFGVLAAVFPGAGALALVLWIGAFAIVYGVTLIALGFRLRRWARRIAEDIGHGFPPGLAPG